MTAPKGKAAPNLSKGLRRYVTPAQSKEWVEFVTELRRIRVEKGVTSRQLGDKLGVDVDRLSYWETGKFAPHPHDLMAWVSALGLVLTVGAGGS